MVQHWMLAFPEDRIIIGSFVIFPRTGSVLLRNPIALWFSKWDPEPPVPLWIRAWHTRHSWSHSITHTGQNQNNHIHCVSPGLLIRVCNKNNFLNSQPKHMFTGFLDHTSVIAALLLPRDLSGWQDYLKVALSFTQYVNWNKHPVPFPPSSGRINMNFSARA